MNAPFEKQKQTKNLASTRLIVSVQNVIKTYVSNSGQKQEVLRGVNLEIPEGEFIALMGASGSGKTTLLNLVGGLDQFDSGTIITDSKDITILNDDERSNFRLYHVGFVFQSFNLIPTLTVIENVSVPLLFQNLKQKEANDRANSLLQEVGLGEKSTRRVDELSGGERQRVAIARALIHEPSLLLADEPTGNLDSKTGAVILDLLRSINESHNLTIIMATHDQQSADASNRVIFMQDGMIQDQSTDE